MDFIPFLFQVNSGNLNALSTYTETTVTLTIAFLSVLAISMQIARPYFLRILRKFTLRLAADMWWLIYILLRDASIFLIVFMGLLLFFPGTYEDYAVAVPFQPLAISVFAIALVLMVIKDTDEEPFWNSILTILVLIGTVLYTTGTVLVTESATALSVLPPTVSAATTNIWGYFNQYFNSMNNPTLAIYSFYVGFGILGLCGLIVILNSFKGGIMNRVIEPKPQPVIKTPAQQPQQPPKQMLPKPPQK